MADQKISQLTTATNPTGGELLAVVQSGTTKKVTVANLLGITPDGSGNVGLGVTPSAWTGGKAIDIGNNGGIFGDGAAYNWAMGITQNAYRLSNGNYRYKAAQPAAAFELDGGQFVWRTAPSGTAGNAISFTQAMTLDASGNLLVGTTSAAGKISIGGSGANRVSMVGVTGTLYIGYDGANDRLQVASNTDIVFQCGGGYVERARIKAEGSLRFVPLSADPTTNVENGDVYYNSTTNKLRVRANGAWVDLH